MISRGQLQAIMPHCPFTRAATFVDPINAAMLAFGIDQTVAREAAFLAQVAEETGELQWIHELSSGEQYEGRSDLGNTEPGDGARFKGRGLLDVTGRANYAACSLAVYGDARLLTTPELLEEPDGASQAGAWFWQTADLNNAADRGDFGLITCRINGSVQSPSTHYDRRLAYWSAAKQALGIG